jgi:hypothetical protein
VADGGIDAALACTRGAFPEKAPAGDAVKAEVVKW